MLARSPYTWLLLVVGYWASIVASKSFAGAYERILLYYTYNVTLKYKGPSQSYILRQLDSVKDSALWQVSYSQKGNRGSLPDGQMTWEEFEASLHNDKSITPKDIPTLNPANFDQVALNLWNKKMGGFFKVELAAGVIPPPKVQYFTYVEGLKEIVKDARANMGDSKIMTELEKMNDLTKRILEIRQAEFRQAIYMGAELQKLFPGIKLETKPFVQWWRPSKPTLTVVNVEATFANSDNKANMPKALGLKNGDAWVKSAIAAVRNYGRTPPAGQKYSAEYTYKILLDSFENWKTVATLPMCEP